MRLSQSEIFALERPDPKLLTYFFLVSLLALILMPLVFLPLLFKYRTLHYRFDEKGISMRWGLLFRHETYLTYKKIQDIHLTRNILERWMGLGTLRIQTASSSADAEMSIQGMLQLEDLRDFIYSQMKGHESVDGVAVQEDQGLMLLAAIRDQLRQINDKLETRS